MKTRMLTLFAATLLIFLWQCGSQVITQQTAVKPPVPASHSTREGFALNASAGGSFTTSKGTVVTLPQQALVDKNGNPVAGEVTLLMEEFHSLAEIMLSGIPMKYQGGDFQSAGMFHIEGEQQGEPVYIKKGMSLTVNMASIDSDTGYHFYALDTLSGEWTELSRNSVAENPDNQKESSTDSTGVPAPPQVWEPVQLKPDQLVIDLDVDYAEFDELKDFEGIIWAYAGEGSGERFMEENSIGTTDWTNIEIQRNPASGGFVLKVKNFEKTVKIPVAPILEGKEFEVAMQKYQSYLAQKEQKEQEELASLNNQQKVFRKFQIADFGIYNCDRLINTAMPLQAAATYKFPEPSILMPSKLYLIDATANTLMYQYASMPLKFNPKNDVKMLHFESDGTIQYCSAADMKKAIAGMELNHIVISFKSLDIDEISAEKLDELLGTQTL